MEFLESVAKLHPSALYQGELFCLREWDQHSPDIALSLYLAALRVGQELQNLSDLQGYHDLEQYQEISPLWIFFAFICCFSGGNFSPNK